MDPADSHRAWPPGARGTCAPGPGRETPSVLRIALVTPMLPVPHDQTRGRYIHETARALSKVASVRVFFQSIRYPKLPGLRPRSFLYEHLDEDYRLEDIDVDAFSYPALPAISRASNAWMAARQLLPRVRQFRPDVVLGYWVYPDGAAAVKVARRLGVPCAVGALGSDIHVRTGFNAWMTRRTIAAADALLTVSRAMKQAAVRDYGADPERVHAIVNGFNTRVFRWYPREQARAALGLSPRLRYIAYIGRFVEAKGLRELISAFRELAARDDALRLVLIGDGVMRQTLRTLIEANDLDRCVILPGGLPPEGVATWLQACDLLTLPSWSEGYPNVVVEALACGRPVVATDVGGTREIIDASNGILVPPRDASALRQALSDALNRVWDERSIARAMARSWDDVAEETLAVCEQLVRRSGETAGRDLAGAFPPRQANPRHAAALRQAQGEGNG